VPFNIPDEPSDSFELRISKKQLMDTFHHDKSKLIQVEAPNECSDASTPSQRQKKFIIQKFQFVNKSPTSNNSHSNMLNTPVQNSITDAGTAKQMLPQMVESVNDELQSSIDFKLTDTVGGTYSS
jgi:hypothetical protein